LPEIKLIYNFRLSFLFTYLTKYHPKKKNNQIRINIKNQW